MPNFESFCDNNSLMINPKYRICDFLRNDAIRHRRPSETSGGSVMSPDIVDGKGNQRQLST